MVSRLGYQSRIGVVIPRISQIKPVVSLSKPARMRLAWIDFFHQHNNDAALTCRHFGIAKSCFYKWLGRFKKYGLSGLESVSTRPRHVRQSSVSLTTISTVKSLRKANPEYSKYKLAVILQRDYNLVLSPSTIGRIILKHNLFYPSPIRPKKHPGRRQTIARLRKPKDFTITKPGDLIEVDVKHLPNTGAKRYAFVAIDTLSKQACIHVASTISSAQGAIAWKKAMNRLIIRQDTAVLNDNGSENLGAFAQLLKGLNTTQYFAKPHTPKDKPHVERFIGSLERECIQWGGVANDLADQQSIIDAWLEKYHDYRPHQSLNYLTPNEFLAKIQT